MNADGTNILKLTTSTALDQMPAWSPDGSKIAFMSTRTGNPEVFVMNANGTNQINITNNSPTADARPSWSRTQNKITFMSMRDGNMEIYLMNGDGTGQTRLTNHPASDDFPFIK